MLASHTRILDAVVAKINSAIAAEGDPALGVRITQVNLVMPDGRAVVLTWNDQAIPHADGSFTGDWQVSMS